jgi:hypothetical protein
MSKVDQYGLGDEILALRGKKLSYVEILKRFEESGQAPKDAGLHEQLLQKWVWRRQKKEMEIVERSDSGRLDRLIGVLERRLSLAEGDEAVSLDSQVKGALAIGKLMELKFKLAGKREGAAVEAPSLSDLLAGMDE